jgi:hypothetical protein
MESNPFAELDNAAWALAAVIATCRAAAARTLGHLRCQGLGVSPEFHGELSPGDAGGHGEGRSQP